MFHKGKGLNEEPTVALPCDPRRRAAKTRRVFRFIPSASRGHGEVFLSSRPSEPPGAAGTATQSEGLADVSNWRRITSDNKEIITGNWPSPQHTSEGLVL